MTKTKIVGALLAALLCTGCSSVGSAMQDVRIPLDDADAIQAAVATALASGDLDGDGVLTGNEHTIWLTRLTLELGAWGLVRGSEER